MNSLQSLPEYEHFIYTLPQRYPTIRRSTLIVIRRGTATAVLTGEVELGGYRLVVREKLSFAQTPGVIKGMGTRSGEVKRSYTGTTHNRTPMT